LLLQLHALAGAYSLPFGGLSFGSVAHVPWWFCVMELR
jgi:hypothetical protein